ncbi:G5 domain-containing protein [Anaerococcus lactolyticus]|uniref:G5 domain-containing protein n=1 Tax=Anaerococcus lactolyticus TaxID=33032 RepID=UPI0023F3F89C|nr:G5 domain-containing protein [Anaerococcus lactolyticus]
MKKYQTAKELLATKAENKEKKPIYATRKLSIGLVSCMLGLLMAAPIARAEELPPAPGVEAAGQQEAPAKVEEAPAKVEEDLLTEEEIKEIKDRALNLGDNKYVFTSYRVDELKERLRKIKAENPDNFAQLKKDAIDKAIIEFIPANRGGERAPSPTPRVNEVNQGDTTVSGTLAMSAKNRAKRKNDITITVTVTRKAGGSETKSVTILHDNTSQEWSVTLGSELQYGDSVSVTQTYSISGIPSNPYEKTIKKEDKDQYKDKIVMPKGVIWIEDTSANLPDFIEKNKALEMFWAQNENLRSNIKSVEFSINGTTNAYYKVTFKDESELRVEATELKIKKPTETTPKPEIKQTFVADGVITIELDKEVAKGTAYGIVKSFSDGEEKKYCDGICKLDKNSPTWYTLDKDTKTITYTVDKDFLQYGQIFGVVVKEYGKKSSCQGASPKIKIPELIGVRDPKKVTDTEKEAIREAIRKANTTNDGKGVSKLPDWTAYNIPAIIDIDNEGNVTIVNPSNVEEDSNEGGTEFKPKRKPDGSLQMKTGKENSGIPIANTKIIENKAPEKPKVEVIGENVVVTPDNKDTDAKEVSVTYETPDGTKKTIIATKDSATNKWSVPKESDGTVDPDSGKITLPVNKVKGGSEVSASVTDDGFKANNQNPATSENGATTLPKVKTKAEQITELGGLDPVVMKKWVKDKLDWKDGVKAKDDAKKDEVNNLLAGATFDDFQDDASKPKRNTDTANNTTGFVGKIKVKFDDGSELVVENQTLYVSDHVTWFSKEKTPGGEVVFNKNTPDDAIVAEFKLGKGTKIDNADGKTAIEGEESPVSYQKYKVKPGTDLKTYVHPTLQSTIYESINKKVKEQDDFIDPVWNTDNFKVTDSNKVFTATATEAFKVTVKPDGGTKAGGGKAEDIVTKVKKNGTYTLPAANTFNPPEGKKFDGWKVGNESTIRKAGDPLTITDNVVITANWIDDKVTKVTKKPIKAKTKYETDDTLEFGKQKVITVAVDGEKEITTVSQKGKKDIVTEKTTKEAVDGLVKIGNKKVEITHDGDTTITTTTTYEVNPNTGQLINPKTVVKKSTKSNPSQPDDPSTPSQPGGGSTSPDTGKTPGERTPEEEQPKENDPIKENPTDPDNNPDQKDKPEDKKTGEDNKNNPKTPKVEKGDKVINVGDKEVVVPKVIVDKKKGKLDKEERTKIAEKIKQKNPDVVDVKIDEKANALVTFSDGRRERIPAKDLVSKEGFVIPRRDRHSQDESPNRRRAGKNVKTGVESIAGIACTLVASTGALYIGRKKED